jgi:hypothetical protein
MSNPEEIVFNLRQAGLNLVAIFDCESLGPEITESIDTTGFAPLADCQLMIIANGGSHFWREMLTDNIDLEAVADPVDHYVLDVISRSFNDDTAFRVIYPGNHFVPLASLGKLSGWHHDSPLGLGIHEKFGLWFAYRSMLVTKKLFTASSQLSVNNTLSSCESCLDKPCVESCPASALAGQHLDIGRCITHRKSEQSTCQATCHARLACPVGREYRYGAEQIAYHYQHSLKSIRRYN